MKTFAAQFSLQVREFPRAVNALHSRCHDPAERLKLAESLRRGNRPDFRQRSASGTIHPLRNGAWDETGGFDRSDPLPSTASLIDSFKLSTRDRSFAEGVGAINVAAKGQVVTNFGPFARALENHYGLSREEVASFDVHDLADSHSDVGDNILSHMTLGDLEREKVRCA